MTDMAQMVLMASAALAAGALNAVAGGGSFLTLPALILVGLPPVTANATGTVALLPGYVSSAYGFREDMRTPTAMSRATLVAVSLVGGGVGAGLLLWTPSDIFSALIPWLLLAATAVFAVSPLILREQSRIGFVSAGTGVMGLFAVCLYGGYFNGGLGIVLLALFTILGQESLNTANGLKNLVSALLTSIAVLIYAIGGAVSWREAILMMLFTTAGGYLGARLVRRIQQAYVRHAIVLIGLVMAGLFFIY